MRNPPGDAMRPNGMSLQRSLQIKPSEMVITGPERASERASRRVDFFHKSFCRNRCPATSCRHRQMLVSKSSSTHSLASPFVPSLQYT